MKWTADKPDEAEKGRLVIHRCAAGPLWVSVWQNHPIHRLAFSFHPFVETTKARGSTLEDAQREALGAARRALADTLGELMPDGEVFI